MYEGDDRVLDVDAGLPPGGGRLPLIQTLECGEEELQADDTQREGHGHREMVEVLPQGLQEVEQGAQTHDAKHHGGEDEEPGSLGGTGWYGTWWSPCCSNVF